MKRCGNLWPEITSFENLLLAARKAQTGKRFRDNVLAFNDQREANLLQLQEELRTHTYQPGTYRTFEVFDPKPRMISAAPYRDRVIHHALCNIIVPPIERTFVANSYANRSGFGSHRALKYFIHSCRSSRYVLQCDLQKYFPSIDHEILKAQLRRKIKCADTLWLIDQIIDHSNPQNSPAFHFPGDELLTPIERRRGLPIGNLTSQFFANVYLNRFDHYVKETLKAPKYLRYVDDFALFSDDRAFLVDARSAIETNLATLRVKVHPIKSQLFETRYGANFVGFRILKINKSNPPEIRIRVRSDNLRRARTRIKMLKQQCQQGQITQIEVDRSLTSWRAHLNHADSWRLQQQIFTPILLG